MVESLTAKVADLVSRQFREQMNATLMLSLRGAPDVYESQDSRWPMMVVEMDHFKYALHIIRNVEFHTENWQLFAGLTYEPVYMGTLKRLLKVRHHDSGDHNETGLVPCGNESMLPSVDRDDDDTDVYNDARSKLRRTSTLTTIRGSILKLWNLQPEQRTTGIKPLDIDFEIEDDTLNELIQSLHTDTNPENSSPFESPNRMQRMMELSEAVATFAVKDFCLQIPRWIQYMARCFLQNPLKLPSKPHCVVRDCHVIKALRIRKREESDDFIKIVSASSSPQLLNTVNRMKCSSCGNLKSYLTVDEGDQFLGFVCCDMAGNLRMIQEDSMAALKVIYCIVSSSVVDNRLRRRY